MRLVLVLALALLVCPARADQPAAVATVDGVSISRKLFDMYVRNGIEELGLATGTADRRRRIEQLEKAVLDELIERAIVEAEVTRRGLPLADDAIADRKRRWVARLGGEPGYRAYLARHALSDGEFLAVVRQELAGETLREALTREVRVGDDEIEAFYGRERGNTAFEHLFVEHETVTARHILLAARPAVGEHELARRRALAEELRRQALAGADFGALAREHSHDAGTRARGGDLGRFTRNTHAPGFDDAAFALAPGEISAVVRTEYGFHLIQVTARAPRRLRSLAEARAAIERHLHASKVAEHLRQWLERRRGEAAIAITGGISHASL